MEKQTDIAIQARHISKKYLLGQISGRTLQQDLQSWWDRRRRREDRNLPVTFDTRLIGQTLWALRDINFTIKKGESLGIIGRNGAGKSTLLKLITQITTPSEGEIGVNGRIASMLEVGTGFSPEMTGRENIYMNGAILGMTKLEIDACMDQIIAFSECDDFIDTPVKRYSSGMYIKLAFSVAAHLKSEIMIMDEVLAVGDAAFQQKCISHMQKLIADDGRTILYVSHNMSTIRRLCNRCILLQDGKILYDGDVEEAIERYMGTVRAREADIDLSSRQRSRKWLRSTPSVQMERIILSDRDAAIYEQGERMKFRITVRSDGDKNGLTFSATVRTGAREPIGYARTLDCLMAEKNVSLQYEMELDTSILAEGHYTLDLVLSEMQNGTIVSIYDVLSDVLGFEVNEKQDLNKGSLKWERHNWGSISFPLIEVSGKKSVSDNDGSKPL